MCVECCWCLCIHKVSFRGASYFFTSVNSYNGVSMLLGLVFKNILLRTYFMDSRKTDLDMPDASEETVELLSKSLYYLATTVTALLIFRGIEKEWRQLIQWTAVVFLMIEFVAMGMYFAVHPDAYTSATFVVTLTSRIVFVCFYMTSLILYSNQIIKEEEESKCEVWEPKFLSSPSGILNGGFNLGLGTLGFGHNTSKWLENELNPSNHQTIQNQNAINTVHHNHDSHYFNDKIELPRYEVCKSSSKK